MKTAITLIRTTVLFLLLSTSLPYFVMSQHSLDIRYTYIDALRLVEAKKHNDYNTIDKIIQNYPIRVIHGDYKKFPFFKYLVPPIYSPPSENKWEELSNSIILPHKNKIEIQRPLSTQFISWEASILNGIANFIATRIKDEITAIAIDQLFQTDTEELKYVKLLLPKTTKVLERNRNKDILFSIMDLECFKHASIIDINALPLNIANNVDTILPDSRQYEKLLIQVGQQISSDVLFGTPIDVIIRNLSQSTQLSSNDTAHKIFQFLHLISCALKAPEGSDHVWVSPSAVSILDLNNDEKPEVSIYYGLLLLQIVNSGLFGESFDPQIVNQLIQTSFYLNYTLDQFKNNDYKMFRSTDEIILYLDRINLLLQFYIKSANIISQKWNREETKSYLSLLSCSLPKLTSYLSINTAVLKRDYKTVFPLLIAEFSDILDIPPDDKKLLFLAGHISSVSSSEEFEAVLESYALPIGASRLKRHSKINLSINCYGGVTIGCEYYNDAPGLREETNIGLAAPIGVAFTFFDGSTSLFLSLLDLGTVVNQRFDGNNASFPQLKLEHFFAPGLGLYFNITDMPISFGFHFNYIPNLRTIEFENSNAIITETKKSVIRLNFSVLVDIPLFTLYNR